MNMACDIITENLIKGIIVKYSRTGITIPQIQNAYYECTGVSWPSICGSEEHAIRYLEQIQGILSIINEKNEVLWYVRGKTFNGGKHGQIFRTNNFNNFDLSTNAHGMDLNTCNQNNNNVRYARNNNNNNNNKYSNLNNNRVKVDRNNNGHNGDNNRNNDQRKQQKYYTNNQRVRVNDNSFGSSSTGSSFSSEPKTCASLYNYDLVGDDHLLELAKIDLGCSYITRNKIHRSGLCISGQRIRDGIERLKRYPHTENMKIIVNLGTVDILHGRDLSDMCQDYMNLIKLCDLRNINVVITTLPPVAHRLHNDADVKKWREFNGFLVSKFGANYQIIDIAKCMICPKSGKTLFDCYQPAPKYMSGSTQPHILWNRIGRQRILKEIKARLRF